MQRSKRGRRRLLALLTMGALLVALIQVGFIRLLESGQQLLKGIQCQPGKALEHHRFGSQSLITDQRSRPSVIAFDTILARFTYSR